MVLRHLHHTTDTEDIKKELLEPGHVVRNIINVRHRQTKEPLNLFHKYLEPAKNNKDIYNLTAIQNKIIYFETPRTSKHHIPQCTRFQQYGHMQKYCNKPYACIKCGGHHNSAAAQNHAILQPNAQCVEAPTRQITKDVDIIIPYLKGTIPAISSLLTAHQRSHRNKPSPHLQSTLHTHNINNNNAVMRM